MRRWPLCLALGTIGIAAPALAQEPPLEGLSISGTSRLRYEAIDGEARAGFNERDDLINLRTTLHAEFRDGPLRMVAELWDSRIYKGDAGAPITAGEVNAFEFVQAFGEFKSKDLLGLGVKASLQAGRFLLNLGSRRLVAADDYRNAPTGYTGVHADLAFRSGWRATLVYALPQQRRPDDPDGLRRNVVALDREGFDLVLWGGLISRTHAIGSVMLEASFFQLGERDRPGRSTRDRSLGTAALRAIRDPEPGHADFEVEGIVQQGRISTTSVASAPKQKVRAWFVHAEAGYTFANSWKTRLSVEYDHASGDRRGGSYGRFDTLFGMRRADLGPSGLYSVSGRTNFISPGLRIETMPDARTDLMAMLRPIWLAAAQDSFSTTGVRDPSGRSGSFAGFQFDGRLRHRLSKELRLELDAVLLAKGRFLRAAPNAPPGRWTRYASFNITASF
jgi:alginate export protein